MVDSPVEVHFPLNWKLMIIITTDVQLLATKCHSVT